MFTPEEQAKLQELEAALAPMGEGVGFPFLEHFRLIKEAIANMDVIGTIREIRNLLDHVLGDEGMHSRPEMQALPWLTILTTILELLKLWRNR